MPATTARSAQTAHFSPALFRFLRELKENNNREWFEQNRERFETDVREPLVQFVVDFAPHLHKISPHFVADPRPSGGSVCRIYRDTRCSQAKTPYKTNAGRLFRHAAGTASPAPATSPHPAPDAVFLGGGPRPPDPPPTAAVRAAIVANPREWQSIKSTLPPGFKIEGDRLSRPPRGYDANHPLIDDLRLKDFTIFTQLDEADACAPAFMDRFVEICRTSAPFMRFLTEAVGQPWK